MVLEKKNFIVDYDEKIIYILGIVDYLEEQMIVFMDYFELNKLNNKIKIIFFNDIEKYKKHLEKYVDYQDYMCADTYDGNINLLSIEEAQKTKEHRNMTVDDLKKIILHEFVHICQKECQLEEYNQNRVIDWFWEALATNLGNPEYFSRDAITATNNEISNFHSLPENYAIAFTIGNYMLENYSHEDILEYVKYPSKLLVDSERILNAARKWSNQKNKTI